MRKLETVGRDDVGAGQQLVANRRRQLFRHVEPSGIAKHRVEDIGPARGAAPGIDHDGDGGDLPGRAEIARHHGIDMTQIGKVRYAFEYVPQQFVRDRAAGAPPVPGMRGQHHRIDEKRLDSKRQENRSGNAVADKTGGHGRMYRKHGCHC